MTIPFLRAALPILALGAVACNRSSPPYVCMCEGEDLAFQEDAVSGADNLAECMDSGEFAFIRDQSQAEAEAIFEGSCCPPGAADCSCACVEQ